MSRFSLLICGLLMAAATVAQEPDADAAPAEDPAVETVPVDQAVAPAEEAPLDSVPVDEPAPAEEPAAEVAAEEVPARDPLKLYAGLDFVSTTLSVSGNRSATSRQLDSGMIRLRGGWQVKEGVGVEAQFGFGQGGAGNGEAKTNGYAGLYLVPTATLLETVELAFPVGFSSISYDTGAGSVDNTGLGYGFNLELPLTLFAQEVPDLRLTLGWMVYSQDSSARSYGANFGIRYDFEADLVRPTEMFGDLFSGGFWE